MVPVFFFLNLIAIFCLFIVQLRTLIVRVNIEIWDLIVINFPFDFIVFVSLVILSLTLQKCYPGNLLSVLTFFSLRYSTLLCRADLVVRNFFSLFSSWENFLFPLIMMDSFGSSSNLGWYLCSFQMWLCYYVLFCLSSFSLRNQLLFWWTCLYVRLVSFLLNLSIIFLCS